MRIVATTFLSIALVGLVVVGSGCSTGEETTPIEREHAEGADHAHSLAGSVTETMDAGGYTYVKLDTPEGEVWAAGPVSEVSVGQELTISTQMPMPGFHSDTLDRTFESLYFVNSFSDDTPAAGSTDSEPKQVTPPADLDLSGIEKADYTVAGLYENKDELSGETVAVRGKVVKFLSGIMGTNWIHLRDGSGASGTNDLTVTTDATARVGDTVKVSGEVTVDKDFGAGYRYDVILQQAEVVVEEATGSESR